MRVVELPLGEKAPAGADRILIRRTDNGDYEADGAMIASGIVARFADLPFHTEQDAIVAATEWAREHGATLIFLERR